MKHSTTQAGASVPSEAAPHVLATYNPWKVKEAFRDAAKFRVFFDALPIDLTGLDLAPLYDLAESEQRDELRKREAAWIPNPANLGTEYNGPISEDGIPLRRNMAKWRNAVEAARLAHTNRFKADFEAMQRSMGDVPHRLRDAAENLMCLALCGDEEGEEEAEWDQCSSAMDVAATRAAINLCLAALAEIEAEAGEVARETAARLRRDLARVEAGAPQC